MTAQLLPPPTPSPTAPPPSSAPSPPSGRRWSAWLRQPRWRRFTALQLLVLGLASVAPLVIGATVTAAALGLVSTETMIEVALGAGENPGMITFGAMFLASPVQWLTGRSQVRVRKYLGITFFGLAVSNGAMFAIEQGLAGALGAPFLVAGTVALVLALPLFLTSSRWSQRVMGMARWRALHRVTYLVAAALVAHVALIGDLGLGSALIALGAVARVPVVRRWLTDRPRRTAATPTPGGPTAPLRSDHGEQGR